MHIVTWNVNGLRAIVKKDFFKSIEEIQPDVLCLQETKASCEEVKEALLPVNGYELYCNAAGKKGYSGTSVLTNQQPQTVMNDIDHEEHDQEGRVICADYNSFYLVNVYTPNAGAGLKRLSYREQWDADFLKYVKGLEQQKPVIVCGDLNVAHQAIDLKNDKANYNKSAGYTQTEIDGMDNLLNAGFVDIFRHRNPDTVAYTYWSFRFNARARNVGWRLDYFLCSESIVEKVKDVKILSDHYGSDHCPVSLKIDM